MTMNIKCERKSCNYNEDNVCTNNSEDIDCGKDIFLCKNCGHVEMKNNPIDTERCPSCRLKSWDINDVKCGNCKNNWRPRSYSTKSCPNCGREIKHVKGEK